MSLFDRIVMVDWSAAATPTLGRDSIWSSEAAVRGGRSREINHPTREGAMTWLGGAIRAALSAGERLLVGFDFAFGYPRGTIGPLGATPSGSTWRDLWAWLAARIEDAPDNCNNRFEVAAAFNALHPGEGPLWGCPAGAVGPDLRPTRPAASPGGLPERRLVEAIATRAQPTGKLAYPGSVGSQVLTGVARLERLRRAFGDAVRIWPFETDFTDALDAPVTLAEIFPSLHPVVPRAGEVRDTAQVRTLATGYAALDRADALRPHLAGPVDPAIRAVALREEAWIVSVGERVLPLEPAP